MRRMRKLTLFQLLFVALFALGACTDKEEPIFRAEQKPDVPREEKDLNQQLADLSNGKDPSDPKASALYDQAIESLTRRGAVIETKLVDTLRRSDDWAVRLGCIEVLQSVGTRKCVDHLIAALLDDQSLVAFHADLTLRELTSHSEIPATGKPMGTNGLPSLPKRAATDLAMDAESKIWADYHAKYKRSLHDGWEAWWKANGATVGIK